VELASNGNEVISMAIERNPDAILMDVMMPDLDGISAVQRIRENETTRKTPILMLTAANNQRQRMRAFNFGADDFISKPFDVAEIICRIQSKLARAKDLQRETPGQKLGAANLMMDVRGYEVFLDGEVLELGPVEFGILELLLKNLGAVVSRKQIMDQVWKDQTKSDRLTDAHLTSLRKNLTGFRGELQTVYGEGYRLKA